MSEPIGGTNTSIFDSDVKRDESIPINDLLSQMKKSENEVKSTLKEETKPEVTTPIHEVQETTKPEKELSPLEQLKMEKEKAGAGMVVSNSELAEGKEKAAGDCKSPVSSLGCASGMSPDYGFYRKSIFVRHGRTEEASEIHAGKR